LNHGGQNSIMDGLVYGVPQIMVPGLVFERQYNAQSVAALGAGRVLTEQDFRPEALRSILDSFEADPTVRQKGARAGEGLLALGGAARVIEVLEEFYR
jgi:UDP:flavonoid glycosyltransferase YjiC (YdhE family)